MIVKYNNFLIVVLNAVFFLIQTSVLHFTALNLTICKTWTMQNGECV